MILKIKNRCTCYGPFNKFEAKRSGLIFTGHTEYLANVFAVSNPLMFMISDRIKVGLVTNHIPIAQVSSSINRGLIVEKLRIMSASLKRDFAISSQRLLFGLKSTLW
jgi:4-hydroxythreonine-4-phosphate dehydrogenase